MTKKPLKILLANNTLSLLAGSETWTQTLALALKKAGHKVSCFSPTLGIISKELEKAGIQCFDNVSPEGVKPFSIVLEEEIKYEYDVIIANHWHIVEYLRSQFPKTPIISTIHGIMHTMEDGTNAPEHPALNAGVNQFVAVSEEVQDMLNVKYNIDSIIIRNFIDIKKFKKKKINTPPKQFLINTNYAGKDDPEINIIREVSKHYGAKLAAIGQNFTQTLDTYPAIEDADVVVGMGRSVLEGVAAGRIGIVHGRWGTGGIIREDTINELRAVNFSGRNSGGEIWSKEKFIEEIDKVIDLDKNADYIAANHNAILAAESYVQIARELLGQDISK